MRGRGHGTEEAENILRGQIMGAFMAGKDTWTSSCNQGGNTKELGERVT